jgi:hypothetical protein
MMVSAAARDGRKVQKTLRLPSSLYRQVKTLVKEENKADSINDFIIAALTAYIKAMHRKIIDDAFCRMAEDADYQKEMLLISEEFAESDAETIHLAAEDVIGG